MSLAGEQHWERVTLTTSRLKVYGGWMVTTEAGTQQESSIYIPDPKHEWVIGHE